MATYKLVVDGDDCGTLDRKDLCAWIVSNVDPDDLAGIVALDVGQTYAVDQQHAASYAVTRVS